MPSAETAVREAVEWLVTSLSKGTASDEADARISPRLTARGDLVALFNRGQRFAACWIAPSSGGRAPHPDFTVDLHAETGTGTAVALAATKSPPEDFHDLAAELLAAVRD